MIKINVIRLLNIHSIIFAVIFILFAMFRNVIQIYSETLFGSLIGATFGLSWIIINIIFAAIRKERSLLLSASLLAIVIGCLINIDISLDRDVFYGKTISKYYNANDLSYTSLRLRKNQRFEIVEDYVLGSNVYVGKYRRNRDTLILKSENEKLDNRPVWWETLIDSGGVLKSIEIPSETFKRK